MPARSLKAGCSVSRCAVHSGSAWAPGSTPMRRSPARSSAKRSVRREPSAGVLNLSRADAKPRPALGRPLSLKRRKMFNPRSGIADLSLPAGDRPAGCPEISGPAKHDTPAAARAHVAAVLFFEREIRCGSPPETRFLPPFSGGRTAASPSPDSSPRCYLGLRRQQVNGRGGDRSPPPPAAQRIESCAALPAGFPVWPGEGAVGAQVVVLALDLDADAALHVSGLCLCVLEVQHRDDQRGGAADGGATSGPIQSNAPSTATTRATSATMLFTWSGTQLLRIGCSGRASGTRRRPGSGLGPVEPRNRWLSRPAGLATPPPRCSRRSGNRHRRRQGDAAAVRGHEHPDPDPLP